VSHFSDWLSEILQQKQKAAGSTADNDAGHSNMHRSWLQQQQQQQQQQQEVEAELSTAPDLCPCIQCTPPLQGVG
jgi:hypothetical protein